MPVEVDLRQLQTVVDEMGTELHGALQVSRGGVAACPAHEARSEQRLRQEPGQPRKPPHLGVPRAQHVVGSVMPGVERQGSNRFVVDEGYGQAVAAGEMLRGRLRERGSREGEGQQRAARHRVSNIECRITNVEYRMTNHEGRSSELPSTFDLRYSILDNLPHLVSQCG
jgi:hypothetical protein